MCGRFSLYSDFPSLCRALGEDVAPQATPLLPRYNIAPGTWLLTFLRPAEGVPLQANLMWWGFKPHWAGPKAPQPINARVESVARSSYFRGALGHHRCVVPADGWFEWRKEGDKKFPHYLTRSDGKPLWMAGIWAPREDESPGCAMLTEEARGEARLVHDRMPVLLDQEGVQRWLSPMATSASDLAITEHCLPERRLTCWPVSRSVNRPQYGTPSLITPQWEKGH